ncbi:MAG: hypothetical protein AB7O50_11585 [Pseudolabrys sp.]
MIGARHRVFGNLRLEWRDGAIANHIEHADVAVHRVDQRFRIGVVGEGNGLHGRHGVKVRNVPASGKTFERVGTEMNGPAPVGKELHKIGSGEIVMSTASADLMSGIPIAIAPMAFLMSNETAASGATISDQWFT